MWQIVRALVTPSFVSPPIPPHPRLPRLARIRREDAPHRHQDYKKKEARQGAKSPEPPSSEENGSIPNDPNKSYGGGRLGRAPSRYILGVDLDREPREGTNAKCSRLAMEGGR